jgi:hypothetical protein
MFWKKNGSVRILIGLNSMVVYEKEELPIVPCKKALTGLQPLDRVKILTSRFGRVYAKG